jgi:hypothetical protein
MMATVVTTTEIDGPLEPVFDLITTTRYWPQWHPATRSVHGVTERPLLLGDQVRERATIGSRAHEGTWTVIERQRPTRLVLLGESGRIRITYDLCARGSATEFKRTLEYQPEDFGGSVIEPIMRDQSEQAVHQIKPFVEHILRDERL